MKLSVVCRKVLGIKKSYEHKYCAAIIVAAGSAERMGGYDKILMPLDGEPVLCHSLRAFCACTLIDEIIVVTREDKLEAVSRLCLPYQKVQQVVVGGKTRADSVFLGLSAASAGTQIAAIHDGARPLVTTEIISAAVEKAEKTGAAAPGVPVKDTIKMVANHKVTMTPDRSKLFAVQTPQVFDYDLLRAALIHVSQQNVPVTDDCSAVEELGMVVHMTKGDEENIKITTPLDVDLANAILKRRKAQCVSDTVTTYTASRQDAT